MKKIAVTIIVFLGLATPILASAQTLTPVQNQIQHLTAIVASLEAQIAALSGAEPACGLVASKTNVKVNEEFTLAWGSVGAMKPEDDPMKQMWSQNGVSQVAIQTPGPWTYKFVFYAKSGATTTCSQKINVSAI